MVRVSLIVVICFAWVLLCEFTFDELFSWVVCCKFWGLISFCCSLGLLFLIFDFRGGYGVTVFCLVFDLLFGFMLR